MSFVVAPDAGATCEAACAAVDVEWAASGCDNAAARACAFETSDLGAPVAACTVALRHAD